MKPIAIYLPQFHPIPENDEWWGKGFTEWTNVTKAKPLFKNHYQPHLPADLGFIDLRLAESRQAQVDLAKTYGIEGFCYYHYWFKGKKLLDRPFEDVLKTGQPDFPFCLFWANETWSRRWLGEEKEVLLKQEYSEDDDIKHAHYLLNAFKDKRYITVNGRPVFVIYKPNDLPNPAATVNTIKRIAIQHIGIEPLLIASNSHFTDAAKLFSFGFDEILNFRPQLGVLPNAFNTTISVKRFINNCISNRTLNGNLKIFDYGKALHLMSEVEPADFDNIIPMVFVGWDNSARRGNKGIIITNNTPEKFADEIIRVVDKMDNSKNNNGLLFINAWNEWAEGNHLEPDHKNGLAYLKVIKQVNEKFK
ncbi:MAG: glycoside hydrolase family 99-like domain-containing protein [Bacteroidetes bacterium]|nr:glycoside hydrolase family 99-like domain-containing protein [Bacteroidota bacterium]